MTSIPNSFQSAKEREEFLFAYNLAKQNQRDNNIDLEEVSGVSRFCFDSLLLTAPSVCSRVGIFA